MHDLWRSNSNSCLDSLFDLTSHWYWWWNYHRTCSSWAPSWKVRLLDSPDRTWYPNWSIHHGLCDAAYRTVLGVLDLCTHELRIVCCIPGIRGRDEICQQRKWRAYQFSSFLQTNTPAAFASTANWPFTTILSGFPQTTVSGQVSTHLDSSISSLDHLLLRKYRNSGRSTNCIRRKVSLERAKNWIAVYWRGHWIRVRWTTQWSSVGLFYQIS